MGNAWMDSEILEIIKKRNRAKKILLKILLFPPKLSTSQEIM